MTGETKKKVEPPLKLDMGFGEFLARALQTDPKEVLESIERSKTKKPPGVEPPGGVRGEGKGKPSSDRNRKPQAGG